MYVNSCNNGDLWSTADALSIIISFLNPRETCRLNQVSKKIQTAITSLCIWERAQYDTSESRSWMAHFYAKVVISQINIREALDMQLKQDLNMIFQIQGTEFDRIPEKWRDKLNQTIKWGVDSQFEKINAERLICTTQAAVKIYTLPELKSLIKKYSNPGSLLALQKMQLLMIKCQPIQITLLQEIMEDFIAQMNNPTIQNECCLTQTSTPHVQEEMQSTDILKKEEDTLENRLQVASIYSKLHLKGLNMKARMEKSCQESLVKNLQLTGGNFKDIPKEKLNQIHQMIKHAVENKAERINSVMLENITQLVAEIYTLPEIKEMISIYSIQSSALQKMEKYMEQMEQGSRKIDEILSEALRAPINEVLQDREFVTDMNHFLGNEDDAVTFRY